MKKYDFVRVVDVEEEHMKVFVGAEGMIIDIGTGPYPIEVCLFNKDLQARIVDEGNLLFKEKELELIGRDE